jgi:hypothetical protein
MKLTDLDTHHPLSILNQCSRNIPVPCTDHQLNSLIIAFRDFLEDAIQARVSMAHTHIPPVSALREFLSESWCSDASKTTQRAAQFLFTHVPETVMNDSAKRTISACLCRCGQSITRTDTRTGPSVGSAEQYTKLRKQYDDLIFSPLDKNTGAMFICCPCTYHEKLKNTFIENASYKAYRTEAARSIPDNNISSFLATEHQVAQQFHYFTEKKPEHYSTPTSYVLAKNKNIIKDRPIVSYTRHRLRKIYNVCSRAILFALNQDTIPLENTGPCSQFTEI